MPPLSHIMSFLSVFRRGTFLVEPYITVPAEQIAYCRQYADYLSDYNWQFEEGTPLNVTCWTETTMRDEKGSRGDPPSFTWLWVQFNESFDGTPYGRPGVGNVDQGGKAGGKGCWLHENEVRDAGDIYFPDRVQYCGAAPHHQAGLPKKNNDQFRCRNCTDLSKPACSITYETGSYGYTDVDCWTNGTAISGNSTWVKLSNYDNCYISPGQFREEWHGLPAGKCIENP